MPSKAWWVLFLKESKSVMPSAARPFQPEQFVAWLFLWVNLILNIPRLDIRTLTLIFHETPVDIALLSDGRNGSFILELPVNFYNVPVLGKLIIIFIA